MNGFYRSSEISSMKSHRKNRLWTTIHTLLSVGAWLFAEHNFSEKTEMFQNFQLLCWALELFGVTFHAFFQTTTLAGGHSLGGLVYSMLFLGQVTAHLTILWDVYTNRKLRALLFQKCLDLDVRLQESKLEVPIDANDYLWKRSVIILIVLIQLSIWHIVISWTTFRVKVIGTSLYWYIFLSVLALQVRILEFSVRIIFLNSRLLHIRNNINTIGERNLERIFHAPNNSRRDVGKGKFLLVPSLHLEEEDERQLKILKSLHNDCFGIFQIINNCYGWSLLAFTTMYFIDFVTNSYWVVLAMITKGRDRLALIQNGGFLWIVVVMLSMICWHCQQSFDYSRQIGCLIFKLVKPYGNKRYNDLVNEFSLQTLHQQFVITAKDFFSLNLNLLGSMVAAIVTYLVILIQFMFTEKSNLERNMTTLEPSNITATMAGRIPLNTSSSLLNDSRV